MRPGNGYTSISSGEVRNAIRLMAAKNATKITRETKAAIANMNDLTDQALIDLHWEIYHQVQQEAN